MPPAANRGDCSGVSQFIGEPRTVSISGNGAVNIFTFFFAVGDLELTNSIYIISNGKKNIRVLNKSFLEQSFQNELSSRTGVPLYFLSPLSRTCCTEVAVVNARTAHGQGVEVNAPVTNFPSSFCLGSAFMAHHVCSPQSGKDHWQTH